MKVTITIDWLVFHEPTSDVLEFIKDHELKHFEKNGKLHVYGTRDELYFMLFTLSNKNDVELI